MKNAIHSTFSNATAFPTLFLRGRGLRHSQARGLGVSQTWMGERLLPNTCTHNPFCRIFRRPPAVRVRNVDKAKLGSWLLFLGGFECPCCHVGNLFQLTRQAPAD